MISSWSLTFLEHPSFRWCSLSPLMASTARKLNEATGCHDMNRWFQAKNDLYSKLNSDSRTKCIMNFLVHFTSDENWMKYVPTIIICSTIRCSRMVLDIFVKFNIIHSENCTNTDYIQKSKVKRSLLKHINIWIHKVAHFNEQSTYEQNTHMR